MTRRHALARGGDRVAYGCAACLAEPRRVAHELRLEAVEALAPW